MKHSIRKLAMAACVALAGSLGLSAGSADARSLDEILSAGTVRVGINPTLPPLGMYNEQNEIVGFDVDFATAIAEMMGVELEIVPVGSPDRIPFVASGQIDFVMGAMTRNPERAKVIDFTLPVHTEVFGVLTTEDKPYADWRGLDSADVTMVQVRGTTPVTFIEENLPNANVTLLDNYPDVIRALSQGRGDAMLDVVDFVGEHMNRYDTAWKVVETPVDVYFCGLGVAKNSAGLKDWLNVAIFDLHRKGRVDEMWEEAFGRPMIYEVPVSPYF